jgi:hypothetical protein
MRALILALLLSGCAHHKRYGYTKEYVKKCNPVLEEILSIQKKRTRLNSRVERAVKRMQSGDISLSDFHAIRDEWIRVENELGETVNDLYRKARGMDCLVAL